MIDLNYAQDNIPSIEKQLELFKQELAYYEDYKFNFVRGINLTSSSDEPSFEKELSTTLLVNSPYQPSLDDTIRWVFIILADKIGFECTKRSTKEVNILLADSYLFPIEENEEIKMKGYVQINFNME